MDQDGGQAEEQDCSQAVPKTEKKELTKEELFKIRKEMMKSKNKKREEVKPV